jgi:hypothetical protein
MGLLVELLDESARRLGAVAFLDPFLELREPGIASSGGEKLTQPLLPRP